jgi:hypothetical protein
VPGGDAGVPGAEGAWAMAGTGKSGRKRFGSTRDRGVASVLAMMFLIIFGSLAVAMAIASQGNMRTSATHIHVVRSMGAAETGMGVARSRLAEVVSRFVVSKGQVDQGFGERVWTGLFSNDDGDVNILPLSDGTVPAGVASGLLTLHGLDENVVVVEGLDAPALGSAPDGLPGGVYQAENWVMTPLISLSVQEDEAGKTDLADAVGTGFQITYAPLANGMDIRCIVTGYDFDQGTASGQPLTRTIMQDFRIVKRVNQAVVSPTRIMIGKNVMVYGDLGANFTDVTYTHGDPLVLRSDFTGLHADLDQKLALLQTKIKTNDVDGDNRLRVNHPVEGAGLAVDLDGDGMPDYSYEDVTNDGYVDEFDEFIRFFDADGDGRVALSDALRDGTPNQNVTAEFTVDDQLALLIDSSNPDRNRNGIYGFMDDNNNGLWEAGEAMLDLDPVSGAQRDVVLGYRDGVIDYKDRYAKVGGRLTFRVAKAAWTDEQGTLDLHLEGPIIPGTGQNAMTFEASEAELPDLNADSFAGTQVELAACVQNAETFAAQVAAQLGISEGQLETYVENGGGLGAPEYYRLDPDADGDGLPDNFDTAHFEKMPFNSPNFSDYYYRPVYKNMIFRDAAIPAGNNGLFINCTFVGVTYVRTTLDNTHVNWSLYGRMNFDNGAGYPVPSCPRSPYLGASLPDDILPPSALPPNQDLLLPDDPANTSLDQGDFPKDGRPQNFDQLPDPLVIDGKRVVDTKLHSNNIRFHDCLFIGSIIGDTATGYTQARNKLQFTGATKFVSQHPDPLLALDVVYQPDADDLEHIVKSSMMLPNYSVDIGSFNSPPEQDIRLNGVIIAGIMDVRGNASINGALLLTFRPVYGQPPLLDPQGNAVGNPAGFNTTLGYFGPDDGDEESLDPSTLPIVDGVKIVGWDVDGDGLPDTAPNDPQPPGGVAVPFYGFGRVELRFDPNMILPDGLMLPLQIDTEVSTYMEGRL